jgi:hypothetical protein
MMYCVFCILCSFCPSLTRHFSEEQESLYPIYFSFLYKTFYAKLKRSVVNSTLVSVMSQAIRNLVYIGEATAITVAVFLITNTLFDPLNTEIVGSNP